METSAEVRACSRHPAWPFPIAASLPRHLGRLAHRPLHPDQRALPLDELAAADAIHSYSFVVTDRDVSTPDRAAAVAVEHWYRHRTSVANVFRDSKHGAALRHLPSSDKNVNFAWTWGALPAANIAGWLHQLTGVLADDRADLLVGHGVRGARR